MRSFRLESAFILQGAACHLRRSRAEGLLRGECSLEWLEDMFVGLVQAGLQQIVRRGADLDATARTVVSAYLEGAGTRHA